MNTGKYFRLNLDESKVVDGIAVYDYIDLPAYFGERKTMSPQYPVSVSITDGGVRFRVHYCAFYSDTKKRFIYDPDGFSGQAIGKLRTSHIQEVILELPYMNRNGGNLSDILKQVYSTSFPSRAADSFMRQLIHRRYCEKTREEDREYGQYYSMMRKSEEGDITYSTLVIMGLRDSLNFMSDKNGETISSVGFIRKLVLDFMFDLQHSDVFQTSSCYSAMYSGLMSDLFFSALIHKCEYYYCRELTRAAIESSVDEKTAYDEKDIIRDLYASRLFESERLWVKDIMNPAVEHLIRCVPDDFDRRPCFLKMRKFFDLVRNSFAPYPFHVRESWFVDPEEELQRVSFPMKTSGCMFPLSAGREANSSCEISGGKHILCNSEVLAKYLGNCGSLTSSIDEIRTSMSQWFMGRFDFKDVMYLHFFPYSSLLLTLSLVAVVAAIFACPGFLVQSNWLPVMGNPTARACVIGLLFAASIIASGLSLSHMRGLEQARRNILLKRTGILTAVLGLIALCFAAKCKLLTIVCLVALVILFIMDVVSNIHLLFPRLISSITAAWVTIALGPELFKSFFDVLPSRYSCLLLASVVLLFSVYEIDRRIRYKHALIKLYRGFQMLLISYVISLGVGLFMINFTAERFLERAGDLPSFYTEHVFHGNEAGAGVTIQANGSERLDSNFFEGRPTRRYVEKLTDVDIVTDSKQGTTRHPIATVWDIDGYKFFILRDFLIQFSFLAMFIGVFLQMAFQEKGIPEI